MPFYSEVAVLSRDNGQLSSRAALGERDAAASEARAQAWERAHESLRADHDALLADHGALERGYAALRGRYDEVEARLERLVEQMRAAARRRWGPSSEACQGQLPLMLNDAEGFADATLPEAGPRGRPGGRGTRGGRGSAGSTGPPCWSRVILAANSRTKIASHQPNQNGHHVRIHNLAYTGNACTPAIGGLWIRKNAMACKRL